MNNVQFRYATENDAALVLEFIKGIATYEKMLDEVNITLNKNAIPFDKQKPFVTSGVRIGTPSVTSRGFKEDDCRKIAELITEIINKKEDAFEYVRAEVKKLIEKYPLYEGVI